jgi:hypothetical protein
MTGDSWTENLKCPRCNRRGVAALSEISQFNNRFDIVPDGFKAVQTEYGPDFHCEACNVPVVM